MSDSANPIGQFTDEIQETAGEVVSEVKDAVGEMVEQGLQSVKASPLTPQQIQQSQQQDQKDLSEARRKINWFKNLAAAQKQVRDQEKQKQMQKTQEQQQEVQEKKVEKVQIRQGTKKPGAPMSEEIARTRQEIGKGHGVGG